MGRAGPCAGAGRGGPGNSGKCSRGNPRLPGEDGPGSPGGLVARRPGVCAPGAPRRVGPAWLRCDDSRCGGSPGRLVDDAFRSPPAGRRGRTSVPGLFAGARRVPGTGPGVLTRSDSCNPRINPARGASLTPSFQIRKSRHTEIKHLPFVTEPVSSSLYWMMVLMITLGP